VKRQKLELSDYLPYLVNRLGSALVQRFSEEALTRHGLVIAEWRVLAALSDSGPLRQIDIAAMTSIEVSTLSRLITRLTRTGLVSRTRSDRSNREVTVALTAQGERLLEELIPVAHRLERAAIAGLPPAQLRAAKAALQAMYDNLMGPRR
jgi:MarR family transcriptional regulator, organic hydroperoxide resistance regulator